MGWVWDTWPEGILSAGEGSRRRRVRHALPSFHPFSHPFQQLKGWPLSAERRGGGPGSQTCALRPGKTGKNLDWPTWAYSSLWAGVAECQVSQEDSPGSAAEPGSPTEAGEQEQEAEQAQDDVQFRLL